MRVAILGCGYVGIELGRQLRESGHDPVGVRRSESGAAAIEDAGFEAVRADVTDADDLTRVPDVDAVVFAASSGGRDAAAARRVYVEGLRTAIDAFGERDSPPEQFVYTSSTGVYGDHGGDWVDEETDLEPTTAKTEVLVEAERVARERAAEHGMAGRVVRFAGLYGPDRYRLERYLSGTVVEGYLNMLHRDDAAGVVRFALTETDEPVLLAVDDEPVSRIALAEWLADACGVEAPETVTRAERLDADDLSEAARRRLTTSKRCSNRLLRSLGYEFAYPTFREGYADAVAAYRESER
ncbi:NAD(P)-dependent oxidoreductase [Halarchaeum grantii]|uniref:NAD(P)-dependent oxidoreductase n=1 Tax=Halarchaeum grantii TaxID=1193105 RepID=A0A830FC82_9EURY|nr:SDR family oxidoreductase [Halarchaeum grantii]GGL32517.1 NAD(P)-dependent oxidoreductase [Halarchaeum grantii]